MKRLVVLVAGLLSVALFAQAEETQKYEREHVLDESTDTSESRVPERGLIPPA